MNFLEKIFDWLFNALMKRQRGQTETAYILALATRKRHAEGKEPEGLEHMREAAEFVVEYCVSHGIEVHHLAVEVYKELGEDLPES